MKLLYSLILVFTYIFYQEREVTAYEYPANTYYIIVDESTLGEIKIHIPSNSIQVLQVTEEYTNVINVSNGSVYGYFTKGNTDYRVTFPTLDNATYRETSASYGTTYNLNINEIIETNIPNLKKIEDRNGFDLIYIEQETMLIIFCLSLLGMVVLLWLKH